MAIRGNDIRLNLADRSNFSSRRSCAIVNSAERKHMIDLKGTSLQHQDRKRNFRSALS